MRTNHTMAIPLSEWREQEAKKDKMQRLVKLAAAAVCIIGAAAHWQTITSTISAMKPGVAQAAKTMPVSSHRQTFGTPQKNTSNPQNTQIKAEAPTQTLKSTALAPPTLPGPLAKLNDISRDAVLGAAKTVTAAAQTVGFHRNSKAYQANPELEQTLLKDHGAQKELAKMISSTYKVPFKTASLIVAKSVVESKKHQVDPFLVLALIGQESSFNKEAESDYGAQGVMQVVPRFHEKTMKKLGVEDIAEAPIGKQIEVGMVVLKEYLGPNKEKPVEVALQHYNQGGNAKIDPTLKYANGVLNKRADLTATVANYVHEMAPTQYASLKPNL